MVEGKIFKAYDIRGLVGSEINVELAEKLGKAVVALLKDKQKLEKIAVGYDMRDSSEELAQALISGIWSQGIDVLNIGLATTPMLNFAVGSRDDVQAGIIITASHNPAEYNGFKISDINVLPIGKNNGMEDLKSLVQANNFVDKSDLGREEKINIVEDYFKKILGLVNLDVNQRIKVAIDTGNGIVGNFIKDILDKLPQIEAVPLYWKLDGNFPNHEANPLKYETLKDLQEVVRKENCDFGVAFDGDGDRVGFVDDKKEILAGDLVTALIAKNLLNKNKGEIILYDLRSSNVVKEVIADNGGQAEECPVGHAFIKALMKEKQALFAGELSSHFYYKDFYNVESGILTFLRIIELLQNNKISLSELVKPMRKYVQSGEMNLRVNKNKESDIFNELVDYYQTQSSDKAERISYLDGLKLAMPEWWFSLRFSNTEPLLRINLEAINESVLHEKKHQLFSLLNKYL